MTQQQIEQQDFVDNKIIELINDLRPENSREYEHNMEITGKLRDAVVEIIARIYSVDEFAIYP